MKVQNSDAVLGIIYGVTVSVMFGQFTFGWNKYGTKTNLSEASFSLSNTLCAEDPSTLRDLN